MRIVSLVLDYNEYTINVYFDKLDSLKIKKSLQVCTSETIRGKNKTFNAYLKPTTITLSGKFSDKVSTNVEVVYKEDIYSSNGLLDKTLDIQKINTYVGKNKSNRLNKMFDSMIEDTRLCDVKTFYKIYENYVITGYNLVYADNSTIEVELTLQEVLLRDLEDYSQSHVITYAQPEKLSDNTEFKNVVTTVVNKIASVLKNIAESLFGSSKKDSKTTKDETSQGGKYTNE